MLQIPHYKSEHVLEAADVLAGFKWLVHKQIAFALEHMHSFLCGKFGSLELVSAACSQHR